jgi:2',3'-cyclic-nucleotide 2'-phosphodiesterase (5'-nucleotidase family)
MTLEDTPSMTVASAVQGLEFENEVKTVNALVPEIKSHGADAIVLLLHQGGQQAPGARTTRARRSRAISSRSSGAIRLLASRR